MNDVDRWTFFDGPEPARLRPVLDALRDGPSASERERVARRIFEKIDALEHGRRAPARAEERPVAEDGHTVRSPALDGSGERPSPDPSSRGSSPADADHGHAAPPASARGSAPEGPVPRAPASVAGTKPLELPPGVREKLREQSFLPFLPPGHPSLPKSAPRTVKTPVMRSGLGETAPVGDDAITRAVAALPFAGNTVGAGVVPFPRLTLEQYASLCCDLAWSREAPDVILLRYHVLSRAGREALDAHWQKQLADRPELRAAFERASAEYTAWLRARHPPRAGG